MRTGWRGAPGARAGATGASDRTARSVAVRADRTLLMLRKGLAEADRRAAAAGLLLRDQVLAADAEVLDIGRAGGRAGAQARGDGEGDADTALAEVGVEDVRAVLGRVHPGDDHRRGRGQLKLALA